MEFKEAVPFDPSKHVRAVPGGSIVVRFTRQEMRVRSPSGVIRMDSTMGRTFTTWFLIKCGLVGVAAAYVFDWAIMSMPV